MLKSHFNIQRSDSDEHIQEEESREEKDKEEESVPGEVETVAEEQQKEAFTNKILSKSDVSMNLSFLGKTADGDGYAYLKVTLTGMGLTKVDAIKSFRHLQFVNLSSNHLDLESLQAVTHLPYLVLIHADKNELNSAALNKSKYLQVMILNNNNITSVHDVYQPELCTLEVGFNKIEKIAFDGNMPHLRCLDFRYNLIQNILDVNFPNLEYLYLAGNKITSLVGLAKLVKLKFLHVRNNPIKLLDGFDEGLKKLEYINMRNCKVSTLRQIKKLKVLPALEILVLKGCPYMGGTGEEEAEVGQEEEDPELRVEVLATLPTVKRLNKLVVSSEERNEARDLMMQWLEDGEKDDEEEVDEELNAEEFHTED